MGRRRHNGTAVAAPHGQMTLPMVPSQVRENTGGLTPEFIEHVTRRVHFEVRAVLGRDGTRISDQEDLEQELLLHVLTQLPRFDASRAMLATFTNRVIRNKLASLRRSHRAAQRNRQARMVSLHDEVLDPDGRPVERWQTLASENDRRRGAGARMDDLDRCELRLDLANALTALPPARREYCELRRFFSVAEIAALRGVGRSSVYAALGAARRPLDDRDLRDYLGKAPARPKTPDPIDRKRAGLQPASGTPAPAAGDFPMPIPAVFQKHQGNGNALVPDLSFLIHEPAEVYHGRAGECLSSHQLADFRRCPLLFHKKRQGLIPDEDRPAYLVGRAAHALILEGREAYEAQFAVGGPINPKTGQPFGSRTKAFEEWAAVQGKPVLTDDQAVLIESLAAAVRGHEQAAAFLAAGVAEGVVRTEYEGEPCQVRLDWLSPAAGIVDLKTCDDLDWLEADARKYGYVHQLALYRAVLARVAGSVLPVHLVAVEKREPFRTGVWRLGEDVLGIAQKDNEAAIARLKDCRSKGHWPTGYEGARVLDWI